MITELVNSPGVVSAVSTYTFLLSQPESLTVTQGPALITLEVGLAGLSARMEEERQRAQRRSCLNIVVAGGQT